MTADPNEILKLIAAIASLVTSFVTLAVAILTLRKAKMELEKTKSGSPQISVPQVATYTTESLVSVTLDDIAKYGKAQTFWSDRANGIQQSSLHGFADPFSATLSFVLKVLKPVQLVENAPIPLAAVRRLRRVETLVGLTVIMGGWPLANWLINSGSITELSSRYSISLASFFFALLVVLGVLQLSDKIILQDSSSQGPTDASE
ncbi:MAG: hypothetical protein U1A72_13385 [Sulfuritalea sp.]|nr:hypothetical protein [Sulfuritalea sp.]